MASSVFFKFKSQKEPRRATFDGTGISVFELKREIILISQLGDGSEFDLSISNQDTNEVYDDDTTIIPRSTSVIARRLPPSKPGQGRAARYVSGKMPATARNTHRLEKSNPSSQHMRGPAPAVRPATNVRGPQTEEEKIAAMMRAGDDQWEQQKQRMADAAPIFRQGGFKKHVNIPDHPPPPTYKCHRCLQKGHWIQACPTNNDQKFDNQPRVKRSTGIPTSFLQKIEKPTPSTDDGLTEETNQPASVMLNADGDFVVAMPDQASWDRYKAKAEASAAQQDDMASGSKELQERGLECPIDKRLFVDPMKTPCCGKTYCNDCIENALVNNDLTCPGCSTDGVLIDNLVSDEDVISKIQAYHEEKKKTATEKSSDPKLPELVAEKTAERLNPSPERAKSSAPGAVETSNRHVKSPSAEKANTTLSATPTTHDQSKKRQAHEELPNNRVPTAPAAMQRSRSNNSNKSNSAKQRPQLPNPNDPNFFEEMTKGMKMGDASVIPNQQMNMGFSMPGMTMSPVMGMGPQMMNPMMMGMQNPMMNPMMMQQFGLGMNGMNGMTSMNGMNGMNGVNGMPFSQQGNFSGGWNGMPQQQPQQQHYHQNGNFMNRQGASLQGQSWAQDGSGNADEDAYMRKPVNPARHPKGPKRVRPIDYRELGQS